MMDTQKKIGDRLKLARKSRRLTQKELAARLVIKYQSIGRWEKGDVTPGAKHLPRLAKALGVRVEWLLTGEGEMRAGGELGGAYSNGGVGSFVVKEGPGISPEERELLEALREDPAALEEVRLYLQTKHALGNEAQVAIVVTPKP